MSLRPSPRSTRRIGTRSIYQALQLDPAIKATAKLSEVAACDLLLMVTPAQELRAIGGELQPYMRPTSRS